MNNLIFKDDQFASKVLGLLGDTAFKAADIGEVVSTAEKIKEGDYQSWCKEWTKTAKRLQKVAEESYSNGHLISARKAYLRASNYYRIAEFYLHENPKNPKIDELYNASLDCFSNVMKLNKPVIEEVKIPYENTTLPGHFYKLEDSDEPKPVLIAMTGFDGTKEAFYGMAMDALEHGMHCITFEGPGQGETVHKQKLFFRHDYEKVITPVVDYLLTRKEVDPKKIVLWGQSLGGYLAPRAAAFEHRLAGCIANGGVYDFLGGFTSIFNMPREEFLNFALSDSEGFNKAVKEKMELNSKAKWSFSHGMYVFGVNTPAEFILKVGDFYMKGLAEKIQCPTLIVDSENDKLLRDQARQLYEELTCYKDFTLFTAEEGAEFHCQAGAKLIANERIFSWIEKILRDI
ncbi:alpha/beta hydrolase family protein [Clostridium beijerinckii]|uniref:alpha/beta hydrolase family protein n=1 Tax=Clostridium beijerinckii TaxID=1520 RepID=UPI00098C18DA|nr:alpha/beta fold hydrolase [Clostridium beijerinckii]NRT78213.1 dienelactone hydrolase [Clostridium beijerinckii]OOM48457.1 2,6-dihydropseudooxynicotine hydrolase [Clostridium beijerinckii]